MDLETLAIRYQTSGEAAVVTSLNDVAAATEQVDYSSRAMVLQQMKAIEMNEALAASNEKAAVSMGEHGFQVGRLRQDLGSLVGRLTGTSMAIDRVGAAFGAMAIGNVAIIGVLGAIAAMSLGWEQLTLHLRGVTKAQDDAIKKFEEAQRLKEQGGEKGQAATGLATEAERVQAKLDTLQRQLDEAKRTNIDPGTGVALHTERIAELDQQIADLRKANQTKLNDAATAGVEYNKQLAKAAEEAQHQYANQLATLIRSNTANKKVYDEALGLEKSYFTAARELANKGQYEIAASFARLGEELKSALATTEKPMKESDLPGLRDFLDTMSKQAAALKANHELQVKLAEDSTKGEADKYATIRALDQAYLTEVISIYGYQSSEYDDMLRTMEEHRKQHDDRELEEAKKQTERLNKIAEDQSVEDERLLHKREQAAKTSATLVATGIEGIAKAAFSKGANIHSVAKEFEDVILKTLGTVLVKQGEAYIAQSSIMLALAPLLSNPFTAGPAALGIGLALVALGSLLGGIASGGVGGGVGSGPVGPPHQVTFNSALNVGGANGASAASTVTPVVPVNVTIIGPNDPTAQRQMMQLIENAQRRNL